MLKDGPGRKEDRDWDFRSVEAITLTEVHEGCHPKEAKVLLSTDFLEEGRNANSVLRCKL